MLRSFHANIPFFAGLTDSIFINSNLARVLIGAYKIFGNESFLNESLAWCDTFVEIQQSITSSRGEPAGYWYTGKSQLFVSISID